MVAPARINPTLFDKLAGGMDVRELADQNAAGAGDASGSMQRFTIARVERFNEEALRSTVRRELGWLLNTTNLASLLDLEPYPEVATSVLNYGVPDLAGKTNTRRVLLQRARDIRTAIRAFEPRMEERSLVVEPIDDIERPNAITYLIHGDVCSAVDALPVKFRTDVELDTAAVTVRE